MGFGDNKFVRAMNTLLKPCNFIAGLGVIATGVIFLLALKPEMFKGILYVVFTTSLGLLLLAGDLNLKTINENCKFLVTYVGRGLFNLFVAGWVFGAYRVLSLYKSGGLVNIGDITSLVTYIVTFQSFKMMLNAF